jgi:SAM-dependent methyltransferase
MLEGDDRFYEGAYENVVRFLPRSEAPWHVWPLWLVNGGYPRVVRRRVPAGATLLELGCAGGVRYFGRRYRAIGCDLSRSSLRKLEGYAARIQADAAACIPLADASVDAVVSSYFWEHIPPATKPRILRECLRVLKPGGKLVFLYDVETRNPLIRRYRESDPALYARLFVEGDGHLGYESPAANREHFVRAGFRVLAQRGQEKSWLLSPSAYRKLEEFGPGASRRFGWTRALTRSPWFHLHTAAVRAFDSVVGGWLPEDWARVEMTVCEKPAGKRIPR